MYAARVLRQEVRATAYRGQTGKMLKQGSPSERKKLLRTCIKEMTLDPESMEVEIQYRIPEPVMNGLVAGAGFEPATFRL